MTSGQFKVFKCHETFYPLLTMRWDISHLKSLFSMRQENHINSLFPGISLFSYINTLKRFSLAHNLIKAFLFLQRDQRERHKQFYKLNYPDD